MLDSGLLHALLSNLPSEIRQGNGIHQTMVEERLRDEGIWDDWDDKPVCPPAS